MKPSENNPSLANEFAAIQSCDYEIGNHTYANMPKEGRLANFSENMFSDDFNNS